MLTPLLARTSDQGFYYALTRLLLKPDCKTQASLCDVADRFVSKLVRTQAFDILIAFYKEVIKRLD